MSSFRRFASCGVLLVSALAWTAPAVGQGVQAATVSGVIQSIDKLPLPKSIHMRVMAAIEAERLARGFEPPFSCIKWLREKWVGMTSKGTPKP